MAHVIKGIAKLYYSAIKGIFGEFPKFGKYGIKIGAIENAKNAKRISCTVL